MTERPSSKFSKIRRKLDSAPHDRSGEDWNEELDKRIQKIAYDLSKLFLRQKLQDQRLQIGFVIVLVGVFIWQLKTMHDVVYLVGRGEFMLTNTQFMSFFVSVFGEITILMAFMIRYLFPESRRG